METRDEVYSRLTGPGGAFALGTEVVHGHKIEVFTDQPQNMGELLQLSAEYGDREYMVSGDQRLTFRDHLTLVHAMAHELQETYGVKRGDRVIIFALNSPSWVALTWAVTSLGAVLAAGNSMGAPAELQHQIDLCGASLVVADERLAERLTSCELSGTRVALISDIVGDALDTYSEAPALPSVGEPDDPAIIIFTSGTTGKPKGATHTHRNVMSAIWFHRLNDAIATELGSPPAPRAYMLAGPLFHIASLHNLSLVRCITGDKVVFYNGRFTAADALRLVERERITNWGAVPTMISRLFDEPLDEYDLSSLRVLTINSAPSTHQLKDEFREKFPHLATTFGTSYGLTESSTAVTIGSPSMLLADPYSVGKPIVTMELEIRDADGRRVPDHIEGEIFIRGALVMRGYWGGDGTTGIDIDGWFATGDIGYLIDDELRIHTRRSDLILRGGENVYPSEVENAATRFPGVDDCITFGVDDAEFGQNIATIIVTSVPESFSLDDFRTHLDRSLAKYKHPAYLYITDEPFALNPMGKVIRSGLAERYPLSLFSPQR